MKTKLLILFCWVLLVLPVSAQLTYKTSWIGNTYPGGDSYSSDPTKAHIQNYIENIWVNRDATDGKIYTTAHWDEGNREKSIIQNGVVIGRMPDPGHRVQLDAITGDGTYIFIAQVIDRGNWSTNGYGLRRFNLDGSAAPMTNGVGADKSYIQIHSSGTDLNKTATALAVNMSSRELYYADPVDGNIKVLDLNNNYSIKATFGIPGISRGNNRLQVATDGYLWWLCRQDKKVYRYSNRGSKQSQEVTGIADPSTICIDKNNKLYVTDNGPNLQIKVYNNINSSPTFEKNIGNTGGIYSGSKGVVEDMKFHPGMSSLGTDANGNVYMASNGVDNATGAILKSINSSGAGLNWQVYGLPFVDCFDVDPTSDGLDIYGRTEHFKMDYSKINGKEWSYKGYTVDKFANPSDNYRGDGTAIIRNRDGRKFMYTIGMTGGGFGLYRFDLAPSEIAVPVGTINRDGGWAWDVDNNCDVWTAGQGGKVRRYSYPGINLNYNSGAPEEWAIPAPLTSVERVKYIAETDVMYLVGYSSAYPNSKGDWGRIGRVIYRYNNWKAGNRTVNATIPLDYTNQEAPKSFDIAGAYAFVTACKEEKTWVYRVSDGGYVGTFLPGPEVNNKSGWVDIAYGTRAFQRSNGEYVILNEEDLFGKVIMYRWCPSGTCSSATVAVTGVGISPTSASVGVGSTTSLTATVNPSNATNKTVTWSSSNNSVATVNTNGLVTGVAVGTATITVTTQDGSKTATSAITVTAPAANPDLIVTDITQTIVSGSTVRFSAIVKNQGTGATASGTIIGVAFSVGGTLINWSDTYTTSLAGGASVTLTANGGSSGTSTWNATSTDYTIQAYVDDVNRIAETNETNNTFSKALSTTGGSITVIGVTVNPTSASVLVGATQQLSSTINPSNATNQSVTWSTSNSSVATVSSTGLVTGIAVGTATITVTTADGGKTATSSITVTAPSGNPDLIVTDITQTIVSGSTVRFSAVVKNQGTSATASGTIIGVAFSVNGTTTNWEDTYTTSLAPGASVTLTATGGPGGVSTWSAPASYTVQAFVDDVNRIVESNETNNTFSKALTSGGSAAKLTGISFTNVDPYGTGAGTNAFDANTTTFVDAKQTSGAYTGLDLGTAHGLNSVKYFPRSGQESRMNGGKFQGSNDGTSYTDLYTIGANPPAGWTTVTISGSYRYVRYINNAANTYCNVAEIEFWGTSAGARMMNSIDLGQQVEQVDFTIYPNPTNAYVNFTFQAEEDGQGQVDFFTVDGRALVEHFFDYKKGSNDVRISIPKQSGTNTLLTILKVGNVHKTYRLIVKK